MRVKNWTKGEWVVESDGYYPVIRKHFHTTHHMNVCGPVYGYMYAEDERAMQIANAQLISAAPELVEALEEARNVLMNSGAESGYCMCGDPIEGHGMWSGHSPVDSHGYMADAAVKKIDTALAKAYGETV